MVKFGMSHMNQKIIIILYPFAFYLEDINGFSQNLLKNLKNPYKKLKIFLKKYFGYLLVITIYFLYYPISESDTLLLDI